MVVLSKSSLNTYITCPKLYKFFYVDKIVIDHKSPQAQRGIDVHQFCCDYYDHIELSGKDLKVDQKWLQEQITIASEDAKPYIFNFLNFEQQRWNICVEKCPENPGKFYIPEMREQKILNLGLEMVGIVDRVDLNFDGKSYTCVDYKTEKFDQRPWKLSEHRREMAFYKILLESSGLLKYPVTHFCIFYPRSNDVWHEAFTNRTLNALKKKLSDVRASIAAGDFTPNVSIFCRWCDAAPMCTFE